MNTAAQLSLRRVVETDYFAFLGFLVPVVLWLVYGFSQLIGGEFLPVPVIAAITVVGLILIFLRYRTIASVFDDGQVVPATITHTSFYRDRGRINYEYVFMGETQKSGNAVHKMRRTTSLKVGDRVTVVVDRANFKRAFIRELYLVGEGSA